MEWGKFLACLFLGEFGVHKFIENKTGWGIAYFLTGGLFGFGWLYDTIGYLLRGIMGERAESADGLPSALAGLAPQKRLIARNVMWMTVVISMFLALLLFPSVTGLFALGMAAIAAPIPKWRAMLDREIKWPFQVLIASGVVVMSLLFLPTAEWTALVFNSAVDAAVPAESPAVTAMAETENVTEALAAARTESPAPTATAAAITETATSPTSEPLPTPTAAPTATPTATTEPTAAATPEATVEETPEPTAEETLEPAPEEEEESLHFVSWSETVHPSGRGKVTIQGKPDTEYSITVYYSSGESTSKDLKPKVSDKKGKVTWRWNIGPNTKPGTFSITVSGGGESESVEFTVE